MTAPSAAVRSHGLTGQLLWALLTVALVVLILVPLLYVVDAAFREEVRFGLSDNYSLEAIRNVYLGEDYLRALGETLLLSSLVTAAALVVGLTLALLVGRTDLPARSWLDILIILPLFLSPFNGLIAWIGLGAERTGFVNGALRGLGGMVGLEIGPVVNVMSYAGAVWVLALFFTPYVYLFTVSNLRAMDSSLEEAGRSCGASPLYIIRRVTLPICLPPILAAGVLVFILSAEMYTIPGVIGASAGFTVLPWQIYGDTINPPVRQAHAAAAASMLLIATIACVWIQRRITRRSERYVTITGKGRRTAEMRLGRWRMPAVAFVWSYIALSSLLPLGALVLSSFMAYSSPTLDPAAFTLAQYRKFFYGTDTRNAFQNTMILAVAASTICVLVGFIISYGEVRTRRLMPRVLAMIAILPIAVPGIVYGVGLYWVYLKTPLYGSLAVLLLAFVAKFMPYGVMVSRSGILQIHPDLEQCGRVCGAGTVRVLAKITAPLVSGTLVGLLFFVMLLSIKELSASVLLYTRNSLVLSVMTWDQIDSGNFNFAATVGVIQTLLIIAIVVSVRLLFRIRLEGTIRKEI